jgi:uncharacterized protein YbjT (DUF2867 family)
MIVVTTPTGAIGQQVLRQLVDAGEPVRVIVREPSRLPAGIVEKIEVVAGSHDDADVVERALAGADSIFLNVPPVPHTADVVATYLDFTRPACEAFRRSGGGRVVVVTALGRGTPMAGNAGMVTASLRKDDLIAESGVACRALAMPSFMDNMLRQVEPIRSKGVFVSPLRGDLKVPHCATRDIADAAVRLLRDPSWSGQAEVPLLGPEDLSFEEIADIMSEVLGKPVRFEQVPLEAYRARFIAQGATEAFADGMADMMAAKIAGLDNAAPRTPESTTPTSFRTWCEYALKPAVLAAG